MTSFFAYISRKWFWICEIFTSHVTKLETLLSFVKKFDRCKFQHDNMCGAWDTHPCLHFSYITSFTIEGFLGRIQNSNKVAKFVTLLFQFYCLISIVVVLVFCCIDKRVLFYIVYGLFSFIHAFVLRLCYIFVTGVCLAIFLWMIKIYFVKVNFKDYMCIINSL